MGRSSRDATAGGVCRCRTEHSDRNTAEAAALVVNREQIDWISAADDDDILLTELLTMPVAAGQGPLVKDFTGQILTADGNVGATR